MVVYVLSLQADLQGIDSIALKPNADICLSVRNPLDHNEVRENVVVDRREFEEDPMAHSNDNRGGDPSGGAVHSNMNKHHHVKHAEAPCHFALKWESASQRSTIRVLDDSGAAEDSSSKKSGGKNKKKSHETSANISASIGAKDSGNPVRILRLECDGIEPYAFHVLGSEFVVTNTAGAVFEELTWTESGNWSVYDLASGTTSISNLQGKLE